MAKNVEREIKQSKINTWKPKNDSEIFVGQNGELFECYFEKVFKTDKDISKYDRFCINKSSYKNQLDHIVLYINFFINFYDPDMEVIAAYLKFAKVIGKERTYNEDGIDGFIDLVYEVLFTPTVVEKIRRLTEDNYKDDIEAQDDDDKKHYLKSEKKHLESLEFTNQHIKVLLGISFGMKIMSPVLFHFARLNDVDISKESDVIFQFYKGLFTIFGYGNNYDIYDIDGIKLYAHNVAEDQVKAHIEAENLQPVEVGFTTRYYFTYHDDSTGEDHEAYYTPIKVQMYNKLFVYVN
jgi:hypothetical protein